MKTTLTIASAILVSLGLFLAFPPLGSFSKATRIQVTGSGPLPKADNHQNCKNNTIYVTERTREIHEREGYDFLVDDNCADLQEKLVESIVNDDLDQIRHLIYKGANAQTADWSTHQPIFPLKVAAYRSSEAVKILVENGADVNQEYCCCAMCSSPLTAAISANRLETARLLIQHGANVEYRPSFSDEEKLSPVEEAIRGGNSDMIQLVRSACEETIRCRIKSRASRLGIRF